MQKTLTELRVCRDPEELYDTAAALFADLAAEGVAARGRFTVVLSGGSTPRGLYELLASEKYRTRISWEKVQFFWGDERCVPPDHPESNYRMAREVLLDQIPIPAENIHRMPAEREDHAVAAAQYEETLREFFQVPVGQWPRFDLILLGMGEDGHTASLFPWTPALAETERLVVANYVEKLGTHRLTLTVPVINQAAVVAFLVTGAPKASVLREVLEGARHPGRLPSQLIRPEKGLLLFILDRAAAKELTIG
jgi:6-phosphogluconolactonase